MKGTILLVDDEPYVRDPLARVLRRNGFVVREASSATDALAEGTFQGADAAIVDLRMPDGDGRDVLRRLLEHEPGLPVVILTGHGSVSTAVECLKAGAYDFVQKPADPEALTLLMERAIRDASMQRELAYLRESEAEDGPIGVSRGWKGVMALAEKAASSDTSVLIVGESGVGKEEVARFIHRNSRRADHAFVAVNCGTIPPHLFESEFFGHRRGAFTGAVSDRAGRFRVAHRGTLFLDEIACMPEESQAKVLRVLHDGVYERLGETQSTSVDTRIIAATNAQLEEETTSGRFREDLYYRIAVLVIHVPPLRERPEDIDALARRFLSEFARKLAKPVETIAPETMHVLQAYGWPGNVRELRNVVERAVLLESGSRLALDGLPPNVRAGGGFGPRPTGASPAAIGDLTGVEDLTLRENLRVTEVALIQEALRRASDTKREAARLLGIDERNLSYFLKKHGLHRSKGKRR